MERELVQTESVYFGGRVTVTGSDGVTVSQWKEIPDFSRFINSYVVFLRIFYAAKVCFGEFIL